MNKEQATKIIKSINRRARNGKIMAGPHAYGVDFITWSITYPHLAKVYCQAGEVITERKGRFMPRF
jgi:hypothetical protein